MPDYIYKYHDYRLKVSADTSKEAYKIARKIHLESKDYKECDCLTKCLGGTFEIMDKKQ